MKSPAAAKALPKLAERARPEQWSYERYAQALLTRSAREALGGEARIRSARLPDRKIDFLHTKGNVILLGPPGTGKTHLAIALSIRACPAGQRVLFRTATEWVALLAEAQRHGRLDEE